MSIEQELVAIEHSLWTNDAAVYDTALVDEALLVFRETGVISKGVAIDAIETENAAGTDDGRVVAAHDAHYRPTGPVHAAG